MINTIIVTPFRGTLKVFVNLLFFYELECLKITYFFDARKIETKKNIMRTFTKVLFCYHAS